MANFSTRKSSTAFSTFQSNLGQLQLFKVCLGVVILVLVGCEGQTFQYSRGWTNGKRGGYPVPNGGTVSGPSPVQPSSFDTDIVSDETVSPSLTLPLSSSGSRGRLRSADYAQYLSKKLSSTGNRKVPLWVLGVESEAMQNNAEF